MAKRFTDTDKWKRPWFRSLTAKNKLIWLYLLDECSHSGVWLGDFELMSFQVGFRVTENDLLQDFIGKVVKFGSDKYFVPSFYEFQYATAKDGFRAKQTALEALKKAGLADESGKIIDWVIHAVEFGDSVDTPPTVQPQSLDCLSISSSKSISSISTKERFDLETVYQEYPLKVGKSDGLKRLRSEIKTRDDFEAFRQSVRNYKAYCERENKAKEYIKHFSTFVSTWRDWLDPATGTASINIKKEKSFLEIIAEREAAGQ